MKEISQKKIWAIAQEKETEYLKETKEEVLKKIRLKLEKMKKENEKWQDEKRYNIHFKFSTRKFKMNDIERVFEELGFKVVSSNCCGGAATYSLGIKKWSKGKSEAQKMIEELNEQVELQIASNRECSEDVYNMIYEKIQNKDFEACSSDYRDSWTDGKPDYYTIKVIIDISINDCIPDVVGKLIGENEGIKYRSTSSSGENKSAWLIDVLLPEEEKKS